MIDEQRLENSAELSPDEIFNQSVEMGVKKVLGLIKDRFSGNENSQDNLDFHNESHTLGVITRAEIILNAIREVTGGESSTLVTNRTFGRVRLAGGFHDADQKWEASLKPDGRKMRRRLSGINEAKSAEEVIAFIEEQNQNSQTGNIYTEDDKRIVTEAILVTEPTYDPTTGTVIQAKKIRGISIEAEAVALADLGSAGMEGAKVAVRDSDELFREENLDIAEAIATSEPIPDAQKSWFKQRMLTQIENQKIFIEGRRQRLDEELANLPEAAQIKLKNEVFNKFDEAITATEEAFKRREVMSFEDLAKDMGYSI